MYRKPKYNNQLGDGFEPEDDVDSLEIPLFRKFAKKIDNKERLLTARFTSLNGGNRKNNRILLYRNQLGLNKQYNVYLVSVGKENFKKIPVSSSLMLMGNSFKETIIIVAGTLQLYNIMTEQKISFIEAYIKAKLLEDLWIEENLPVIEKLKKLWIIKWDTLIRAEKFTTEMERFVKAVRMYIESRVKFGSYESMGKGVHKVNVKKALRAFNLVAENIKDEASYQPFYLEYMKEIITKDTLFGKPVKDSVNTSIIEFLKRNKNLTSNENHRIYMRQELIALTRFFLESKYKLSNKYKSVTLDCSQITNISYPGSLNDVLGKMIDIVNIIRSNSKLKWRTIKFKRITISKKEYSNMQKMETNGFYEQFLDTAYFEMFPEKAKCNNPNILNKLLKMYAAGKIK